MEKVITGGNEEQSSTTLTENLGNKNEGALPNFNLSDFEDKTEKTPEQITAEKVAKDLEEKEAADKLAASKNETFFESEGKQFKLDDKGNALNEDGTVFKTKVELDALKAAEETNDDIDDSVINEAIQLTGITILGEDNKPKVYEDSVTGIVEYAKDLAEYQVKQSQNAFFKQYPQAKELASHLANGGSESDFYKAKTASWKNVAIDEANEAQQIEIITKDLTARDFSKEEIEDHIKLYKDSNKLLEKSKVSLDNRRKDEVLQDTKKVEADKKAQADYEVKVKAHWDSVSAVIKKGELTNFVIPEADKDPFFKYIATAIDKDGNSQYDLDEMSADTPTDLDYKYLRFKGLKIDTLIKNEAAKLRARSLKDRLNKEKKEINNGGDNANTNERVAFSTVGATDISLEDQFKTK